MELVSIFLDGNGWPIPDRCYVLLAVALVRDLKCEMKYVEYKLGVHNDGDLLRPGIMDWCVLFFVERIEIHMT